MALIKSNWPSLTDFFDDDWLAGRFPMKNWGPAINVVSNDSNYEIEVAAPGFKKNEFTVSVENGILTVTGKTERENEEKDKNYTRKEFTRRTFTKSFTLPEDVLAEDVEAKYEDGVLKMMLKKSEKALPPKKEVIIE